MTVDCTKDGYAPGHQIAISHFGGATAGNIIAGGLIGMGVDAASGANYSYDNLITVPLGAPVTAMVSAPAPAPAAAPVTPPPAKPGS